MKRNVLLIGRATTVLQDVMSQLQIEEVVFFGATNVEEVRRAVDRESIDVVIMGAGLDLDDRLEMVRSIFSRTGGATVHMKDWMSGPAGMLPFVQGVLAGTGGADPT